MKICSKSFVDGVEGVDNVFLQGAPQCVDSNQRSRAIERGHEVLCITVVVVMSSLVINISDYYHNYYIVLHWYHHDCFEWCVQEWHQRCSGEKNTFWSYARVELMSVCEPSDEDQRRIKIVSLQKQRATASTRGSWRDRFHSDQLNSCNEL